MARREGWLDQELALARLFCRIDRKAAFVAASCASIQELASRRGYDAPRARDLGRLGYALEAEPELEALLRANEIGFAAALALGRIPLLLEPDDEWVRWARFERLSDLRRRIQRRAESVRQGQPATVAWTAHVTTATAENLARCRQVASRRAGAMLTNGQLLDVISTAYLLENDELERGQQGQPLGRRRLPPTAERPADRTIPAEVSRALEERSGGLCEFGACERLAVETCHLVPHRDGSGREITDLARGCHAHHKSYDAGLIRFLGWTRIRGTKNPQDGEDGEDGAAATTHGRTADVQGAGLPVFLATETGEVLKPKPRPAPREPRQRPAWLLRALGTRLRRRLEGRDLGGRDLGGSDLGGSDLGGSDLRGKEKPSSGKPREGQAGEPPEHKRPKRGNEAPGEQSARAPPDEGGP